MIVTGIILIWIILIIIILAFMIGANVGNNKDDN